jgi:hypothetical protein
MVKRFWKVQCYDGQQESILRSIPFSTLSEPQIITLLQRLASRHLNEEEVIFASLRKKAKSYSSLLEVTSNNFGKYALMVTSGNFTYTATIFTNN